MFEKFCHQCGTGYSVGFTYNQPCSKCGFIIYQNPIPVGVAVIEIEGYGLLGVKRAIAPKGLALVGGFLETQSNWQDEIFREVYEETSLKYDNQTLEIIEMTSTPDNSKILIFAKLPAISFKEFKKLKVNDNENEEVIIINKNNINEIVFDFHKSIALAQLELL